MNFNTKLLHGKAVKRYSDGATLPAIAEVNAFSYDSAEELEKVFNHKAMGFAYSRVANPTVAAFESRLNELENGSGTVAMNSGMTAISLSLLNFLSSGDEIIASSGLYGGSLDLLEDLLKFNIRTRFVSELSPGKIKEAINEHTRVIFGEMISNPGLRVMDIEAVSEVAHENNIPLIVDSTTATPYLINPLDHGADIVIHSTTKYINGSGDALGGVVIDGGKFKWDFDRFKGLSGYKSYGKAAYLVRLRTDIGENMGGAMNPMSAFLNVIGLETLGLRMEKICENAKTIAAALSEKYPKLDVNYPLLESSRCQGLAKELLKGKGGGIFTFRAGSKEKAYSIINDLKYSIRATSIGDVRTLVIHPASTLYIRSSEEDRIAAGVYDDTVRVSVGIEDPLDLLSDFEETIKKHI